VYTGVLYDHSMTHLMSYVHGLCSEFKNKVFECRYLRLQHEFKVRVFDVNICVKKLICDLCLPIRIHAKVSMAFSGPKVCLISHF
jgi:hypothetical protein